jgi:hypothetical protein
MSESNACHAPLQAGHPVTTSFDTVLQKQPRWLLDRPVKPGDDTHREAIILRDALSVGLLGLLFRGARQEGPAHEPFGWLVIVSRRWCGTGPLGKSHLHGARHVFVKAAASARNQSRKQTIL